MGCRRSRSYDFNGRMKEKKLKTERGSKMHMRGKAAAVCKVLCVESFGVHHLSC